MTHKQKPERVEPVKWQRQNPGHGWIDTAEEDLPFYKERGFPVRPLYTRPANVAALEKALNDIGNEVLEGAEPFLDAVIRILKTVGVDPLNGSDPVDQVADLEDQVTALEDRVKELESEICSIRERVKGAASSVMGIRTDAMNGDNLAITLASYFEDLLGERGPNGWHPGAQKACDEIEAAIAAHMAAAIHKEEQA